MYFLILLFYFTVFFNNWIKQTNKQQHQKQNTSYKLCHQTSCKSCKDATDTKIFNNLKFDKETVYIEYINQTLAF